MTRRDANTAMPTITLSRSELEAVLERRCAESTPLATLIEAAHGPTRQREAGGLGPALAAFHAGQWRNAVAGSHAARRRQAVRSVAGRVVAAKALVVCFATVTLGGFAYAAASGNHPGIEQDQPAPPGPSALGSGAGPASSSQAGPSGQYSDRGVNAASTLPAGIAAPTLVPIMRGLCVGWLVASASGTPATDSRYAPLIRSAGGLGNVAAYCGIVLSEVPAPGTAAGRPSNAPDHTKQPPGPPSTGSNNGHPSHTPSHGNTTHPGGKPTPTSTPTKPTHSAAAPTHPAG